MSGCPMPSLLFTCQACGKKGADVRPLFEDSRYRGAPPRNSQLITGKIDGANDLARNVLLPTYGVADPL
jgi:hypothetical protein